MRWQKIGRVKVDRCIGMYPPKAGAKAQRAKLRGDRCLKDSRNLRRKKEDLKGHTRSAKAMVGSAKFFYSREKQLKMQKCFGCSWSCAKTIYPKALQNYWF